MLSARSKRIAIVSILVTILLGSSTDLLARAFDGSTNGGTIISNRAEATYQDGAGENFSTVSETVTVTVQTVVSLAVTPDETSPSDRISPHAQVTRLFRVCNTGNYSDSFTLTHADITAPATISAFYFDNDGSGTVNADDQLPAAIDYVSGSLKLNDRSLADEGSESSVRDNHIRVFIARVNPGESFRISFVARLARSVADGSGLVNTASFTADNTPPVKSSPAIVVIDPFGFVFAGRAGRSAPIAGARVE